MDSITMTFPKDINVSVQVNDIAYYLQSTGPDVITKIGKITAVGDKTITVEIDDAATRPTSSQFILFSKDNKANLTAVRGYYAEVKMRNDSNEYAELFSVGSEIFESSK